jgi:hypothetical protein
MGINIIGNSRKFAKNEKATIYECPAGEGKRSIVEPSISQWGLEIVEELGMDSNNFVSRPQPTFDFNRKCYNVQRLNRCVHLSKRHGP